MALFLRAARFAIKFVFTLDFMMDMVSFMINKLIKLSLHQPKMLWL